MQSFRPVIRWWTVVTPRLIAHFTEVLEVHADRLTFRKGLFNKSEIVIPFSRITNYSADQRVVDRVFGVGDFRIETAGSTITPELVLKGYSYQLREILAQAIDRNAR
jgi:membrane protein YdbS with pleckstrin-like domain